MLAIWNFAHVLTADVYMYIALWGLKVRMEMFAKWWHHTWIIKDPDLNSPKHKEMICLVLGELIVWQTMIKFHPSQLLSKLYIYIAWLEVKSCPYFFVFVGNSFCSFAAVREYCFFTASWIYTGIMFLSSCSSLAEYWRFATSNSGEPTTR